MLEAVDEQPVVKESSDAPVEGGQADSPAGVIAKPISTPLLPKNTSVLHNNMSADNKIARSTCFRNRIHCQNKDCAG